MPYFFDHHPNSALASSVRFLQEFEACKFPSEWLNLTLEDARCKCNNTLALCPLILKVAKIMRSSLESCLRDACLPSHLLDLLEDVELP